MVKIAARVAKHAARPESHVVNLASAVGSTRTFAVLKAQNAAATHVVKQACAVELSAQTSATMRTSVVILDVNFGRAGGEEGVSRRFGDWIIMAAVTADA
jgi:hypothetical protein